MKKKKLSFRTKRVLLMFPIDGQYSLSELVDIYNQKYPPVRIRVLSWLLRLQMHAKRMERIIVILTVLGLIEMTLADDQPHYRLTPKGIQAKQLK